eukprot:215267-Chlamydomonas_euryale.AAC.2
MLQGYSMLGSSATACADLLFCAACQQAQPVAQAAGLHRAAQAARPCRTFGFSCHGWEGAVAGSVLLSERSTSQWTCTWICMYTKAWRVCPGSPESG